MKKFLPFIALLAWSAVSWGQTGTGVVLLTDASHTFTPTTVDSTSTFEFQLQNTVGIAQTVYFGGLDGPFALADNTPVDVESQGLIDLSISFTPGAVGTFSDTLEVVGSIFGNAELILSGDGIQVQLELTTDALTFDVTPIGQTNTQMLTLSSVGDGAAVIGNFSFSTPVFSLDSSNTDLSIGEGESGTLSVVFAPVGAGVFSETVTFETNDPNNQFVTIALQATSISEVSGEVCNVTWALADSPFTLVENIVIPESCVLTVEAGTEIIMDGFQMDIYGELELSGTVENPIYIVDGRINYGEGEESNVENVIFSSSPLQSEESFEIPNGEYVLLYRNDFENSDQQYDFNCYQYRNNNYYTGSNTGSGSYGCDNFARNSSSSWSLQENTGDHYLRFYSSSGGDGYLYLDSPPTAPESGFYEFSFTYESDRYESGCYLTVDVDKNGYWHTKYRSPVDIASNSSMTRFARAIDYFEEGETLNFRIKHNNSVASGNYDQMYTYIDEVRIEKVRAVENRVDWNFQNNASDFLANASGFHGNEKRVSLSGDILEINSYETTINFNTSSWTNAPIVVPESGWYFVSIENQLVEASFNTTQYVDYRLNSGSWRRVVDNPQQYNEAPGADTYSWREDVVRSVEFFNAGDRVDFRFYGTNWTTEGQTDWETRRISIYQLSDSVTAITESNSDSSFGITSNRALNVVNANIPRVFIGGESETSSFSSSNIEKIELTAAEVSSSLFEITSDTVVVSSPYSALTIDNSSISSIQTAGGECHLIESEASSLNVGETASLEVYFNDFSDASRHYEFDCFDYRANQFITGSTSSYGSYGCDSFSVTSSSSWSLQSNDDDNYLSFYSNNGGDAYLILDETLFAPANGVYEFSFTYESDRYENSCFMTIDVFVDGYWKTVYQSPLDIEGNSSFTRVAKGSHPFTAGEPMTFRIRHHNNVDDSSSDQMWTYIDNVRIAKSQDQANIVEWDFQNNISDFNSISSSYGNHGNERRVKLYGDTLRINSWESTVNFNTQGWSNAPIIVPVSGWYVIEIDNRLNSACANSNQYVDYSRNSSSWYRIVDNVTRYGYAHGTQPYNWRKDRIVGFDYFQAGDRIDFKFYGNYWTTSGQTDWETRGIRIYSFDPSDFNTGLVESASLLIEDSELQNLSSTVNTTATIARSTISGAQGTGLSLLGNENHLSLHHSVVSNHSGSGITIGGENNTLTIGNSIISNNGNSGIQTTGALQEFQYLTIADNADYGIQAIMNGPTSIQNCILSNNGGGSYSAEGVLTEYNYTGSYPQFQDGSYHLELYSPAVDAAMPWHTDEYMPYGIGGLRADMGAYGGPNNAGWGGEPAPSGDPTISSISDSPQDQGNMVGISFEASAFDDTMIPDNVTSYAFWRHYDPTGQSIGDLDDGNWELLGEMPAQSFNGYAFQAPTLGNTNAFGTFNSCYTVVAQTDDPDTYWYSNVLCGESVDNLAPVEPELEGMVLETGGVTVFWEIPSEEDYAYTEVTSDAGFTAEITGDTLAVDLSAELGGTYTYTAVHYDVNGNASDPASLTLALEPGFDVITLNAGWNLISTDRAVTQGVDEVFAGLAAGNLQYVTGFDNGVQFYDPNGLSFLNTLGSLTPGNGYWVKVSEDDVLELSGVRLAEDFMPGLAEGWNLVGYAAEAPAAPASVFAELEASGDLLYVTGFDEGVEVYDPNGLPFLNTLTEMRNGFGYWVKSAVATDGDVLAPMTGDVLPAEMPTPRYDVVNGVSELGAYAGEFVDVMNGWGVTVARLPIVEGGHLMTTALFGDDPATGVVEGLADGEALHFAFRGAMANETLVFGGDMAHKTLSLTFDEVDVAMGVFPNPASDVATFRFQLDMDAQVELALVDLAGRQVAVLLDANKGAGAHAETLTFPSVPAGAYNVQLRVAGEVAGTQRLVVTH